MNNPLNNLPPFYIGQKVMYVVGNKLSKEDTYTVSHIEQRWCGCWAICINGDSPNSIVSKNGFARCTNCNKQRESEFLTNNIYPASSFRPLQEQTFPLITYSKVLKEVPVSAN